MTEEQKQGMPLKAKIKRLKAAREVIPVTEESLRNGLLNMEIRLRDELCQEVVRRLLAYFKNNETFVSRKDNSRQVISDIKNYVIQTAE